nr:polyketide synthase [Colletotrichum truncatum]KAF6786903.1 polyketide synthase [Colletotrichum truncatum]
MSSNVLCFRNRKLLGCRWAGGVRDVPGLWEFLTNNRSEYKDWAEPRFSVNGFYHPNPDRPGTTAAKGGYLTDDPRLFDPAFFGISGLEAETIDPSQRKLLEVVYEAFESAGETWESVNGTRTGVYVADISYDNAYAQTRDFDYARPHATTGVSHNMLSNRINYVFNLSGPSVTIDSACTSSLYGLHIAMQAIRDGDCDSAIVATSNWIMDPSMQIAMDKLGALSATSMSHAFDAAADGYARGEGFAAIYLKTPEKAMQDGSPIRALVRGSAIGANGRSSGITHPSGSAQEDIIRKAYANAGGLLPSNTPFLECHGTGTRVGDPLEVEAAGNVFGLGRSDDPDDRLLIGSVKTNLGHTEGAAALASIFKVVLALEAGMIPPSVGVKTLNPKIDFDKAKAKVVTELMPWPKGKPRRASVTSAGFGGSIGHCIIDHVNVVYPEYTKPDFIVHKASVFANGTQSMDITNEPTRLPHVNADARFPETQHQNGFATNHHPTLLCEPRTVGKADAVTRKFVLLPFSAHNDTSLKANIAILSHDIGRHSLADVAYTLAARRSKLPRRTFRIVDHENSGRELVEDVQQIFTSPSEDARLGFVFTGQGAQWHAMGAQLLEYKAFRATIKHLDQVLVILPGKPPAWTLIDVLSGNYNAEHVQMPEISQPACTAVQIGLVDLLATWSIRPSGVIGHSSGEIAAAYAGGFITAAEAIAAAYLRGHAVSRNKRRGAMLAVGLSIEETHIYLKGLEQDIKIAAYNSPGSLTLSGDQDSIEVLAATLTSDGVFNRLLKTGGNAYHSHHMGAIGENYEALLTAGFDHLKKLGLRDQRHRYPLTHWTSSVTPNKKMTAEELRPSYWRANLESAVRFTEAITSLLEQEDQGVGAFLEIGPHTALKSPLNQINKGIGRALPYVGSLKRDEDNRMSLLNLAGNLFCLNTKINLAAVNATDDNDTEAQQTLIHGVTAKDLPPYQYTYGPISYFESRLSKEFRLRKVPRHDLTGSKLAGSAKLRPQFRNILRLKDLPWLGEHRLLPDAVFPAAGYMCMAMVAASQVYDEFPNALSVSGYSLRNVDIKTALKIPEDQYGIEIMLSLELTDTETAKKPAWATFSVSSVARDSDQWTEHCTGQVMVDVSNDCLHDKMRVSDTEESRAVNTQAWYKKFASIGLGYGTAFQALSNIRADPMENLASARLNLKTTSGTIKGGESGYPIHPASLDSVIQLGLLASHGGQTERLSSAFVPVHLSQLYLRAGNDQDWGTAVASGELRGLRSAYLKLQLQDQAGGIVLNVEELRCVRYNLDEQTAGKSHTQAFSSPFLRMIYKPDFRTLSKRQIQTLFKPPPENLSCVPALEHLEFMAALIAVDVYERLINGLDPATWINTNSNTHYIEWIRRIVEEGASKEILEAKMSPALQRLQSIRDEYQECKNLVEANALLRLHENMEDILQNRKMGEEVLGQGGLLADFFDKSLLLIGAYPQLVNIFGSMSHANPSLRILEIKGGRGRTAKAILERLTSENGIKFYRDYTVTDISEAALQTSQEELAGYHDVTFSILDMEQDTLSQGYQEAAYDVVVASQAIHTASSITKALENVRRLLKPGGKLVLVEATGSINSNWVGLVGGAQASFWHTFEDGRINSPLLDVQAWDSALLSTGFSGSELVLDDYPRPRTHSTVIVSTLAEHKDPGRQTPDLPVVCLLHSQEGAPKLLDQLKNTLQGRGQNTKTIILENVLSEMPDNARVIAFLDGEYLMLDADQRRLDVFKHLARHTASMVWITSTGMAQGRSPNGSVLGGLLRTIATEAPTGRFFSVDVDADNFNMNPADTEEFLRILVVREENLQQLARGDNVEDGEFAWHTGCWWVSRLVPEMALRGYAEQHVRPATHNFKVLPLDSQGPMRVDFETPGILSSIFFCPYTELLRQPLPPNFLEVKVAAVGLNWKDLALSAGRFDGNNLSSEYAGVVTQVGTNAGDYFAVGDRVYGLGKGHFGNYARVPMEMARKVGPDDDLVKVATMPVVYMTAIYAFEHLTRLRRGQKVLIQSASGGLGLGAIQLARAKGAEVFAAAGSPEKLRFLVESIGVSPSNVYLAREPAELIRTISATQNGGFDVILSTAQGEMLYQTMKALAPLGHLIDVGRMDVSDAKTIGLELFQKSASLSSFDLVRVVDHDPELGAQLMKTVDEHYRAGLIGPILPLATSDISQLDQTMLAFSKGKHVGKLVVTFLNPDSLVRMVPATPVSKFDTEAWYIVAGGLSGLGRSIILWMAERGARYIAILSRRGDTAPEAQSLVNDMAKRGVQMWPVACDLANQRQVMQAIEQASATKPIKGVVHCAVLYEDISFDRLSLEGWRNGLAAKVTGTMNLHEATKGLSLDFFVMTTSILSVVSFATQSAYNAANNFQDHFARYRRRLGLPATAAQFGLVNDVGHLSTVALTLDLMNRNKVVTISESQFLQLLEPAFLSQEATQAGSTFTGVADDPLAAATYVTCVNPADMAAREHDDGDLASSNSPSPRWYSDGRVSHVIRAFEDALRHQRESGNTSTFGPDGTDNGPRANTARLRRDFDEIMNRTCAAADGGSDHRSLYRSNAIELVTIAISGAVANMLLMDIAGVSTMRSVADHGVDSLIAAELRHWLHLALGSKISMIDLLDPHMNIKALAAHIVDAAMTAHK